MQIQEMATTCESLAPVSVHDKGVAPVVPTELHHQSELVDGACILKQWHQLVLVHVPGQLPHKDLASPRWRWSLPSCSTTTSAAG